MHGKARTFSQKVIAGIGYDSRREMSGVAFRTAPPIGGLSCFLLRKAISPPVAGGRQNAAPLKLDTKP